MKLATLIVQPYVSVLLMAAFMLLVNSACQRQVPEPNIGATVAAAIGATQTALAPTSTSAPSVPTAIPHHRTMPTGNCSLSGRSVSCEVFRDQIMTESIADFSGLDCDVMANIAGFRIEGWAAAEATGKVTKDEGYNAGRAISSAVNQLGCGNS